MSQNTMRLFTQTTFIAMIALAVLPFQACKKGPDDPVISLRSRTARLTGVWKLTKDESTTTIFRNGSLESTIVSSFDGAFRTVVTNKNNGSGSPEITTEKQAYSATWSINKDHTLKMESIQDGETYIREGTWVWLDGNGKDVKNKEVVKFLISKETVQGTTITTSGVKDGPTCILLRLANDEMQLDQSVTFDSEGYSTNTIGKQTFKQ